MAGARKNRVRLLWKDVTPHAHRSRWRRLRMPSRARPCGGWGAFFPRWREVPSPPPASLERSRTQKNLSGISVLAFGWRRHGKEAGHRQLSGKEPRDKSRRCRPWPGPSRGLCDDGLGGTGGVSGGSRLPAPVLPSPVSRRRELQRHPPVGGCIPGRSCPTLTWHHLGMSATMNRQADPRARNVQSGSGRYNQLRTASNFQLLLKPRRRSV